MNRRSCRLLCINQGAFGLKIKRKCKKNRFLAYRSIGIRKFMEAIDEVFIVPDIRIGFKTS